MILGNEKTTGTDSHLFKDDNKSVREYKAHKDKVLDLSFNKTGDLLVTASSDWKLMVWDLGKECAKVSDLKGHSDAVEKLACHPIDPNIVLSSAADKVIKLWDLRTKNAVRTEKTKAQNWNIIWKPDGSMFASYVKDQFANFFEVSKPGNCTTLKFDKISLRDGSILSNVGLSDISWDATGNIFMAATSERDHSLLLFDSRKIDSFAEHSLTLNAGPCFYVAVDPSQKLIATWGNDYTIALLDATEFIPVKYITQVQSHLNQMNFSYDGTYLSTASEQTSINIYSTKTGEMVQSIDTPGTQYSVSWHPDKYILAFAGEDKQTKTDRQEGSFRIIGLGKDPSLSVPVQIVVPLS